MVGWVVVEQDQLSNFGCGGHLTGHCDGRVTISLSGREASHLSVIVRIHVLRVVDQQIRILSESDQPAVGTNVALDIRRIDER